MIDFSEMNIAVIMGGTSAEREVSLRSGQAILDALKRKNIKTHSVDGIKQLLTLDIKQFDAVFNILHGEAGENGELAGLLSGLNIKYTGCDINGAVLSWNKDIAKTLISAIALNTPKSQTLTQCSQLNITDSGPWIVKPTKEGSSVGLYFAKTIDELKIAVDKALNEVSSILVETFIKGTECTVAIIKENILPIIRIEPSVGLYDYKAKYESKKTAYYCPSGYDEDLEQAIKKDALVIYKTLKLKGWARIDFMVDEMDNRWFLEANTTPGMTATSLVPIAAKAIGWSFDDLVLQILSTAFTEGDNHV